MNNKPQDLNNILFEQLERLNDDDLKGDELKEQLEKAKNIAKLSTTIVNNNKVMLESVKVFSDAGYMVNGNTSMVALGLKEAKKTEEINFNNVKFGK